MLHHPKPTANEPSPSPRLIILPSDAPSANPQADPSTLGRPLTPSYSSVSRILSFMDKHHIRTSVLSLANPWLDFLPAADGPKWSHTINDELESISVENPGRFYYFGALPLSSPVPDVVNTLASFSSSSHCRGVILGTSGRGSGLDDPALDPMWAALDSSKLLTFIHPHYGLASEVFGPRMTGSGHVLPLSLGFTMETTIAFVRMWLCGVFDRFSRLQVLLAHAGAAMGSLAGRVQSCVQHERRYHAEGQKVGGPRRSLREVLRANVWLDGISYGATGLRTAVDLVGKDRIMWGSDHPFFPPLYGNEEEEEWESVRTNLEAVRNVLADDDEGMKAILSGNAINFLRLDISSAGGLGRKSES
ncbi:MAG: hypothetical protein Q9174_005178 [Haloplaca sp. 1 TL-2023]